MVRPGGGRLRGRRRTRRLPGAAFPNTFNRSFTIAVPIVADSDRSDGVLVCLGTGFNGIALYVREGVLSLAVNLCGAAVTHVRASGPIESGEHLVEYRFDYDGGGLGRGGTARLLVDGAEVATGRIERTSFFGAGRLTVGANPGIPVTEDYARGGEYAYTGRIGEVTISAAGAGYEPSPGQKLEQELVVH